MTWDESCVPDLLLPLVHFNAVHIHNAVYLQCDALISTWVVLCCLDINITLHANAINVALVSSVACAILIFVLVSMDITAHYSVLFSVDALWPLVHDKYSVFSPEECDLEHNYELSEERNFQPDEIFCFIEMKQRLHKMLPTYKMNMKYRFSLNLFCTDGESGLKSCSFLHHKRQREDRMDMVKWIVQFWHRAGLMKTMSLRTQHHHQQPLRVCCNPVWRSRGAGSVSRQIVSEHADHHLSEPKAWQNKLQRWELQQSS